MGFEHGRCLDIMTSKLRYMINRICVEEEGCVKTEPRVSGSSDEPLSGTVVVLPELYDY